MATLSDKRFDALRLDGYTGSTSDMMLAWLKDQTPGSTAKTIPDAWREFLIAQSAGFGSPDPATYHRSDWWFAYLGAQGYTGSMNDRELKFWDSKLT